MKKTFAVVLALTVLLSMCIMGTGVAEEKTKLTFWTWLPTDSQWEPIYAAFEAANPDIEIEYWRTSEQSDYLKKLQVAIASGTGPDLFGLQPGSLVSQYAQFCEPMDALADQYMAGWKDIVATAAVDQCVSMDGVMTGMPILQAGQEYMLYNKTLMNECGVDSVPTTYEELVAASEKIKAAGKVPMVMGAADVWHDVDWFVAVSQQFAPGAIAQAEKGELAWTDEAFVKTMEAWLKFFNDGIFEDGALGIGTYPDARDQYFYAREAVFFPTGSWHVTVVDPTNAELEGTEVQKAGDVLGMTIFPQVGDSPAVACTGVDFLLSVNKDSANKEAAMKFVEFMTTGEGQQMWTDMLQGSPVSNQIVFGGEVQGELAQESIELINKYNNEAIGARKLNYSELETALGVAMQEAAAGRGVEDVLKDVQAVSDGIER